MKIGIDISQSVYKGTGVGRYTHNLIKGLVQYGPQHDYVLFFSSLRQKAPNEIVQQLKKNFILKTFRFPPSVLNVIWNKVHVLPIENLIGNVDVFYSSDWVEPPALYTKKATTIHDLAFLRYPETAPSKTSFNLKNFRLSQNITATHQERLKWVKKESKAIFCISETTKRDAQELLAIEADRLKVVYQGVEIQPPTQQVLEHIKLKYESVKPYILTVGTVQPRKNLQRLINAFNHLKFKDLNLYIIGAQGWGDTLQNTNENVKVLGYVPDEDLAALYKNSLFFVMPSLYEGFGYPIVEAMKMGKAVAASNTSSMKEITEGYGLTFDPFSEDQICQSLIQLYEDTNLRRTLEQKSVQRANDFTLEKFIKKFLYILETL